MFVFGSGVLIGTPCRRLADQFRPGAGSVAQRRRPPPRRSTASTTFPVAIGSGTKKMTGKAKMARISGQALGALFFGIDAERRLDA